ncbi:AAA family ATPase [Paenibacillus sp. 2TAB23]|uniref:AAA family ATPase n=1 Tax=Paenibacillus sp. 2TAB23 TaxID=3233004 RepID=UPI003F954465
MGEEERKALRMIIMINGAFGVGKTSTAAKLQEKIPNSMLFDPEEVGYMLRRMLTDEIKNEHEKTDNFQDLDLWRVLVVQAAQAIKFKYQRTLIVPMTIYNKDYFHYIYEGFKELDNQTYHFCLTASEEVIFERLKKRGEVEGNWCFQQTKRCLDAFQDACFEPYIWTDTIEVSE